ncbi:MAG TPA: carboxymuconolactone decarboxylase family protein [Candidatus Krumholzibacterium sp.]|nr:carboxymuconolactone decarboxylase family protein [Candidatus Krumholzibacterium sp.]
MSELCEKSQSLVSLGAAIASNCIPCIEYHIPGARRAGLTDAQIGEAIRIADKVRRVPANAVLQSALAKIRTVPAEPADEDGPGCGCSGSNEESESCE